MRFRSGWTRARCCWTHRMSLLEALLPDSTGMRWPAGLVVVVGARVVGAAVAGGSVVVPAAVDGPPPDPSPSQPTSTSVTARVSAASPPILRVRLRVRELPTRSSAPDRSPKAHLSHARLTIIESLEPITLDAKSPSPSGGATRRRVPSTLQVITRIGRLQLHCAHLLRTRLGLQGGATCGFWERLLTALPAVVHGSPCADPARTDAGSHRRCAPSAARAAAHPAVLAPRAVSTARRCRCGTPTGPW